MLIRTKVEEVVEVWRLFRISLCRISYDLLITFFLYKISDKERALNLLRILRKSIS